MADEKNSDQVETPVAAPEKAEGPSDWAHRKPQYNGQGGIDCELHHPKFGWIPFTASPDDKRSCDLYDKMSNGSAGDVAPAPAQSQEQAAEDWKQERTRLVAEITVQIDGKVFDGDEESQARMARAVTVLQLQPKGSEVPWTLADNTVTSVTLPVLAAALTESMKRMAELWQRPA